jgi:hypothetical protein
MVAELAVRSSLRASLAGRIVQGTDAAAGALTLGLLRIRFDV